MPTKVILDVDTGTDDAVALMTAALSPSCAWRRSFTRTSSTCWLPRTADLAQRAHISLDTLSKIERGQLTVMIGSYFQVATLLGVELWEADLDSVERYKDRFRDRLALLPARVRPTNNEIEVR